MLGYICAFCDKLITIARIGEKRDCPACGCPAAYTVKPARKPVQEYVS
jgi:DNA-directed RNA polymerase subunit RPC12/RpoP